MVNIAIDLQSRHVRIRTRVDYIQADASHEQYMQR